MRRRRNLIASEGRAAEGSQTGNSLPGEGYGSVRTTWLLTESLFLLKVGRVGAEPDVQVGVSGEGIAVLVQTGRQGQVIGAASYLIP